MIAPRAVVYSKTDMISSLFIQILRLFGVPCGVYGYYTRRRRVCDSDRIRYLELDIAGL